MQDILQDAPQHLVFTLDDCLTAAGLNPDEDREDVANMWMYGWIDSTVTPPYFNGSRPRPWCDISTHTVRGGQAVYKDVSTSHRKLLGEYMRRLDLIGRWQAVDDKRPLEAAAAASRMPEVPPAIQHQAREESPARRRPKKSSSKSRSAKKRRKRARQRTPPMAGDAGGEGQAPV